MGCRASYTLAQQSELGGDEREHAEGSARWVAETGRLAPVVHAVKAAGRIVLPPSRHAGDVHGDALSVTGPDGERVYIKLDAPAAPPSGSSRTRPTRGTERCPLRISPASLLHRRTDSSIGAPGELMG